MERYTERGKSAAGKASEYEREIRGKSVDTGDGRLQQERERRKTAGTIGKDISYAVPERGYDSGNEYSTKIRKELEIDKRNASNIGGVTNKRTSSIKIEDGMEGRGRGSIEKTQSKGTSKTVQVVQNLFLKASQIIVQTRLDSELELGESSKQVEEHTGPQLQQSLEGSLGTISGSQMFFNRNESEKGEKGAGGEKVSEEGRRSRVKTNRWFSIELREREALRELTSEWREMVEKGTIGNRAMYIEVYLDTSEIGQDKILAVRRERDGIQKEIKIDRVVEERRYFGGVDTGNRRTGRDIDRQKAEGKRSEIAKRYLERSPQRLSRSYSGIGRDVLQERAKLEGDVYARQYGNKRQDIGGEGRERSKRVEKIVLETWKIEVDTEIGRREKDLPNVDELPGVYKKAVIYFRTLFGYVHLLPSMHFMQKKKYMENSPVMEGIKLGYRVARNTIGDSRSGGGVISVFEKMYEGEADTKYERFSSLATPMGNFDVSASYREDWNFEVIPKSTVEGSSVAVGESLNAERDIIGNAGIIGIDDNFFTPTLASYGSGSRRESVASRGSGNNHSGTSWTSRYGGFMNNHYSSSLPDTGNMVINRGRNVIPSIKNDVSATTRPRTLSGSAGGSGGDMIGERSGDIEIISNAVSMRNRKLKQAVTGSYGAATTPSSSSPSSLHSLSSSSRMNIRAQNPASNSIAFKQQNTALDHLQQQSSSISSLNANLTSDGEIILQPTSKYIGATTVVPSLTLVNPFKQPGTGASIPIAAVPQSHSVHVVGQPQPYTKAGQSHENDTTNIGPGGGDAISTSLTTKPTPLMIHNNNSFGSSSNMFANALDSQRQVKRLSSSFQRRHSYRASGGISAAMENNTINLSKNYNNSTGNNSVLSNVSTGLVHPTNVEAVRQDIAAQTDESNIDSEADQVKDFIRLLDIQKEAPPVFYKESVPSTGSLPLNFELGDHASPGKNSKSTNKKASNLSKLLLFDQQQQHKIHRQKQKSRNDEPRGLSGDRSIGHFSKRNEDCVMTHNFDREIGTDASRHNRHDNEHRYGSYAGYDRGEGRSKSKTKIESRSRSRSESRSRSRSGSYSGNSREMFPYTEQEHSYNARSSTRRREPRSKKKNNIGISADDDLIFTMSNSSLTNIK
ncbi:Autophagy-related protein 13 [Zancudomyces culisetae]|uniref:Autophagy-related protein 13 n=1 Tax=Zancudomyces culisetae TaxID=1213189 RepID=A0A1R1PZI1_ZANCU|nr:Autophagy-related protein 13 [Zancudomyces culisetae]|eukprot:OMH86337.1 Autophagy-related protein 13 [Zancudomyces culisetae]